MPEEQQNLPEAQPKNDAIEAATTVWNQKLAEIIIQALMGGGLGTFITLLGTSELPKLALGGVLGGAAPIAYALVSPTLKKTKRGAEFAGEAGAEFVEEKAIAVVTKVSGVEGRYFEAQAKACEGYRPEGVRQYEQIKKPILRDVFVPLALGEMGQIGGYATPDRVGKFEDDEIVIAQRENQLDIWKLLKRAERDPAFTKIAVLAWGGSGKTTLLKHVASVFGREEHRKYGVKLKVPFLLALRNYRSAISQGMIPALADLIHEVHIPKLPAGGEIGQSLDWVKDTLRSGRAIVMLDGFDEVANDQRSVVAQWMNEQMRLYGKSVFIITSRPKAYREQSPAHQMDVTMPIWVRDFNDPQRRQFIEQWYRCQERMAAGEPKETEATTRDALEATDALMTQINDRPELQALAKNPLLLNMIVTFHRRRPWGTLPTLRSDLYRDICQLQLVDRPEARGVETVLPGVDALLILQQLALEMMQREIQRIPEEDLLLLLTKYLQAEGETIEAKRFLEDVVSISELLVDQVEEYDFAHLSFQEYLAASEIVRTKQESIVLKNLGNDRWKALILYYVGLVRNPSTVIGAMVSQGNTTLAYECLKETKRCDASVMAALEALKTQVKTDRYTELESLLKSGKWQEADQETNKVMLQAANQEDRGYLDEEDLKNFPCEDLLTIDRLWVEASNGHFGFSVQKKIWEECGSPTTDGKEWDRFCVIVGWQNSNATAYVNYNDLKKNPFLSPRGELPQTCTANKIQLNMYFSSALFSRNDL